MKIRKITKLLMFSSIIAALFAVTCFMSSAASQTIEFTGYDDTTWEDVAFTLKYKDSVAFTGSALDPSIKVYKGGADSTKTLLTKGVDYDVNYNDPNSKNLYTPGNHRVCVYSLSDDISFSYYFDIKVTYDKSLLSIGEIAARTYNGKEYTPKLKVYYNDVLLSTKLYDTECYGHTNAGTYSAYVEFDWDDKYFSLETSYTIKPASISKLTIPEVKDKTYCGEYIYPTMNIKFGDIKLQNYTDYEMTGTNNKDVGTATIKIKFTRNFTGTKTIKFNIKKLSASKVTVNPIATQGYAGYKIEPYIHAEVGDDYLRSGEDFTVKYSNNVKIGTAKAKLDFSKSKNITGTKTVEFQIGVDEVEIEDARTTENYVDFWFWSRGIDEPSAKIAVYKYNTSSKKYEYIGSTKECGFADKDVKEFKTYKYRVRAIVTQDGKTYYGKYSYKTVTTGLFSPVGVKLSVSKGKNTISWNKRSSADGYYVYRYDWEKESKKKLATIKKNSTVKYVDESVTNYKEYVYWVVAYKEVDGKIKKSSESTKISSGDPEVISAAAKLTPKTSFKVMNVQGSKTKVAWTVNLSKNDIATLDKFAKAHFKKDWTAYQKVEYTLRWIHDKVKYARSTEDWNKIGSKSYVDAIFNYKLGQCAQYNGALAAMMTHLGYDVELILGYRHYNSQHLWVECKINGLTYVMEAGNNKDGGWCYLFTPYRYAYGYTKNGKMMG